MVIYMIFHGILIVSLLFIFNKWIDDSTLIDICLYSLLLELIISSFSLIYIYMSNYTFMLNIGKIFSDNFFFNIYLNFYFDEISNVFFFILDFALIICFYFLIEYYEYDSNSTGIILLSSMFSHTALWFFCVYDLFLLFFFWELISLISFFLIQYWCFRLPSYKASMKVFVISQLGDIPFFFFFFLLISRFSTTDLFEIQGQLFFLSFEYIQLFNLNFFLNFGCFLSLLLIFAIFLKSAQFFFYPWLLDAMEAPVPISAQLHSSTLVIIGFYIFFRFQNIVVLNELSSLFLLFFGFFSVICSSILGFFQNDGKKLLACSTASQLGYVILGLGLCYYEESLLMLMFCCCNKAFTFVWFGILIDKFNGLSDMRIIGGVFSLTWFEHMGILISLCNFTIVPGVFSWQIKSLFIKGQYSFSFFLLKYCFDILLVTWFFTSLYLIYLYISLFLKPCRQFLQNTNFLNYKFSIFNFSFNYKSNSIIVLLVLVFILKFSKSFFFSNNKLIRFSLSRIKQFFFFLKNLHFLYLDHSFLFFFLVLLFYCFRSFLYFHLFLILLDLIVFFYIMTFFFLIFLLFSLL